MIFLTDWIHWPGLLPAAETLHIQFICQDCSSWSSISEGNDNYRLDWTGRQQTTYYQAVVCPVSTDDHSRHGTLKGKYQKCRADKTHFNSANAPKGSHGIRSSSSFRQDDLHRRKSRDAEKQHQIKMDFIPQVSLKSENHTGPLKIPTTTTTIKSASKWPRNKNLIIE